MDQEVDLDSEVIIVDSDSSDCTKDVAKKYGCKLLNIAVSDFSWGKGLNVGIAAAQGKYCMLLSAHSYPKDKKVLARLVKPLVKNENVVASYGRQIPIDGVDPFEEIELSLWFPADSVKNKMGISDANACIKKEMWYSYKFDETLSSCEDAEWAERVQQAGYSLVYVPKAACYHSHEIKIGSIYRRWYWRQRVFVYVSRNRKNVVLVSKFSPSIVALLLASSRFITWSYRSIIHCLRKNYFTSLWKAPFYEFIRMYALYRGVRDGLTDIKQKRVHNAFSYYQLSTPPFLKKFNFIT